MRRVWRHVDSWAASFLQHTVFEIKVTSRGPSFKDSAIVFGTTRLRRGLRLRTRQGCTCSQSSQSASLSTPDARCNATLLHDQRWANPAQHASGPRSWKVWSIDLITRASFSVARYDTDPWVFIGNRPLSSRLRTDEPCSTGVQGSSPSRDLRSSVPRSLGSRSRLTALIALMRASAARVSCFARLLNIGRPHARYQHAARHAGSCALLRAGKYMHRGYDGCGNLCVRRSMTNASEVTAMAE